MAVISGKEGTLELNDAEETPVTNIRVSITSANDAYAANDTAGWKKRVAGTKDSTGSFSMKDKPSVEEGDKRTLKVYTNQDVWTQPIIIDSIDPEIDINDGTTTGFEVSFSGDGAGSWTTGSAP